ncbi:magnesium chelatase subunit I [Roseibium hamelinense]|uniref:Mg-protoporphyrin IX chelatase n=1 Tax=Roseibium hamelinense TaxID=150831 RepID=A0A562SXD2_9HYPH|nr:magnesium chelatase ATPase subunit I [Roseibium hamelinense]MTI44832.1 magnesium chelatase ATPase subunit I [Roseibium hamelinense]TWI85975.1 magnesium chelatase subunit I [Roseibium hamelinense]
MQSPFPFSAIVGQDEMKHALLLAAIEPALGGVLVFGDRGTGKSTAVRALANLLPKIETRKGCSYNCVPAHPSSECTICNSSPKPAKVKVTAPIVDLPLGATEDSVCGALDLEKALLKGERSFAPGLLAKAHRGFLYIDEVNLLEDHLVDLLLDVAASGTNVVEREGLSVRHPAKFIMVGSGNPEEGELRPQLLDRFGLSVDVSSPKDVKTRVEVVKRREAYEASTGSFCADWAAMDQKLQRRVLAARKLIPDMETPDSVFAFCAELCLRLGIDGLRGELTLIRAARAHAAFEKRSTVTLKDAVSVAPMALCHRLRRDPLDEAGSTARVSRALGEVSQMTVGNA